MALDISTNYFVFGSIGCGCGWLLVWKYFVLKSTQRCRILKFFFFFFCHSVHTASIFSPNLSVAGNIGGGCDWLLVGKYFISSKSTQKCRILLLWFYWRLLFCAFEFTWLQILHGTGVLLGGLVMEVTVSWFESLLVLKSTPGCGTLLVLNLDNGVFLH